MKKLKLMNEKMVNWLKIVVNVGGVFRSKSESYLRQQ